jgi:hypothetical protein
VFSGVGPTDLAAETRTLGSMGSWQVAVEQGALLTMLACLTGARRAVEGGTFTGYGAISSARGLAPGGQLLCCGRQPAIGDLRIFGSRLGWTEILTSAHGAGALTDRANYFVRRPRIVLKESTWIGDGRRAAPHATLSHTCAARWHKARRGSGGAMTRRPQVGTT